MALVETDEGAVDADLMRRVQADDVSAFEQLYNRHAHHAYRLARSVCGRTDRAEEAVQEAFLSIWRRRDRFQPGAGSVRVWSMSIVRQAAIDLLRYDAAAKRPALVEEPIDPPNPQLDSVIDIVVARSECKALRAALARLPEAQAEVIGLAFFGELTHTEVAEQLQLPPGTVKGRIRLGLKKLRGELK